MQLVTEENITDLAVRRWATAHDPRAAELLTALVRHLHDFAREVRLTEAEWMAAIQWLNRTGQISDDKREEFILTSDVLGLSMLVVQMNHRLDPRATPATVLGPFHIEGSPELGFGADMSQGLPGTPLYLHGTVRDLAGNPVPGAVLDVWQADNEGLYESQHADVDEARLRAKYTSREDGTFCVRTVAPLGYTIPIDRAMALVAAGAAPASNAGLPSTRQEWNELGVVRGPGRAIQEVPDESVLTSGENAVARPPADGQEEVGVDEDVDTVELIENDGDLDADGAEAVPDNIE